MKDQDFFLRLHIEAIHDAWNTECINARINERAAMIEWITECDRGDGQMYVCESGRDCDGVEYLRGRYLIAASYEAYMHELDRIGKWADGPFHLSILRPDEQVEPYSRDLTLEAFEDGHPHVIYG